VASTLEIRPQPGPQELALASTADIAIMGGGAFGGKTWALTIEPLRHVNNPAFSTVYFRRTYPELTNPGGVWDEMRRWYPLLGAKSNRSDLVWTFPSGMRVQCSHLQWEDSVDSWAGAQVPLINFDQLEQFTERQFWFLLSRNRSASGVKGYVRATCNPDPDSFVLMMRAMLYRIGLARYAISLELPIRFTGQMISVILCWLFLRWRLRKIRLNR
jgi:hypothetical protein